MNYLIGLLSSAPSICILGLVFSLYSVLSLVPYFYEGEDDPCK